MGHKRRRRHHPRNERLNCCRAAETSPTNFRPKEALDWTPVTNADEERKTSRRSLRQTGVLCCRHQRQGDASQDLQSGRRRREPKTATTDLVGPTPNENRLPRPHVCTASRATLLSVHDSARMIRSSAQS